MILSLLYIIQAEIMNRRIIWRVILAVLAMLVVLLIVAQIINSCSSGIKTETATHATVDDTVKVENCRIIRKESLVKNTEDGVLSYEVQDGEKIAKGGTIAYIYDDAEAAANESKRVSLENQLEQLQTLSENASKSSANPESISKNIYQKLYTMKSDINDYNYKTVSEDKDSLVNYMNQWQLATNKITGFDSRISELKSEIESLKSSKESGKVTADKAGFFVQETDGYENVYDYSKAKRLTVSDLQTEYEPKKVSENTIGKICQNFEWYVCGVISADTAQKLQVGTTIQIQLPYVSSSEIPAEIIAINQEDKDSDAALILSCDYMDSTFAGIRDETVILDIDTYDGIMVSQSAIHFNTVTTEVEDDNGNKTTVSQEVTGVYVIDGSSMKFVQIIPLYSTENYVICDANPDADELLTDETVALYDTVAIGGDELYDGKSTL